MIIIPRALGTILGGANGGATPTPTPEPPVEPTGSYDYTNATVTLTNKVISTAYNVEIVVAGIVTNDNTNVNNLKLFFTGYNKKTSGTKGTYFVNINKSPNGTYYKVHSSKGLETEPFEPYVFTKIEVYDVSGNVIQTYEPEDEAVQ